ncbi:hypothetical protein [Pseudomonas sp.]|uniref:DUF4870 family protein n=1 Tax=Pseudomonas sp. TaxID=306 RepID=UPI0027202CF1|nr:hypothetical protein [Pseudomonas sp.]MDO9622956.1 hypothetical protein [Pseudomonas sp.]MDP2246268.1 hypothetical protein [Pseudomonas sp.]
MNNNPNPAEVAAAEPGAPVVSQSNMAFIVYILYIAGFFTGITALIGVCLAHGNSSIQDPVLRSHFSYQIRTFYWGLLWCVIGWASSVIIIGWFVLLAWMVWTIVRIVKGMNALNLRQAIS